MKKLLPLAVAVLVSMAAAATLPAYMLFTTTDGTLYSIPAKRLEIRYSEGEMTAAIATETLSLPVDNLVSMEFSDQPSGVESAIMAPGGKISVISVGGVSLGTFDSIQEAVNALGAGIYIIETEKGETHKLIVGK